MKVRILILINSTYRFSPFGLLLILINFLHQNDSVQALNEKPTYLQLFNKYLKFKFWLNDQPSTDNFFTKTKFMYPARIYIKEQPSADEIPI